MAIAMINLNSKSKDPSDSKTEDFQEEEKQMNCSGSFNGIAQGS